MYYKKEKNTSVCEPLYYTGTHTHTHTHTHRAVYKYYLLGLKEFAHNNGGAATLEFAGFKEVQEPMWQGLSCSSCSLWNVGYGQELSIKVGIIIKGIGLVNKYDTITVSLLLTLLFMWGVCVCVCVCVCEVNNILEREVGSYI